MKYFFALPLLLLASCSQADNADKSNTADQTDSVSLKVKTENKKEIHIDYSKSEKITGENGAYIFELPKGLYIEVKPNEFASELLDSKINFSYSETGSIDGPDAIWTKEDLVKKMKENITVTYVEDKKDWAVVSGTGNNGEIFYKKGYYYKPADNHMGENGRNTQPSCLTSILEIRYNKDFAREFDTLIPIIMNSYKCNLRSLCYNCD